MDANESKDTPSGKNIISTPLETEALDFESAIGDVEEIKDHELMNFECEVQEPISQQPIVNSTRRYGDDPEEYEDTQSQG